MNIKPAVVSSNKQTEEKRQSFLLLVVKNDNGETSELLLDCYRNIFTAGVFQNSLCLFP